ncbi:hypothetical protein ACJ41O_014956 [Fusarium nematophilum]
MYTWKSKDTSQYVSLRDLAEDSDLFTHMIMNVMAKLFHFLCGERFKAGTIVDVESGLTSYSDSSLVTASNVIALVICSALPVVTIFVLNILDTTTKRIGFTVLFTTVFAITLALFSSAKRVEIFAATATFAAIEVVFIGSALGSGGSSS